MRQVLFADTLPKLMLLDELILPHQLQWHHSMLEPDMLKKAKAYLDVHTTYMKLVSRGIPYEAYFVLRFKFGFKNITNDLIHE